MIQVNPKAKPKPWWKSKAIWSAAASVLLGIYEVVQSYRHDLPPISEALYLFLAGFSVFGLRMSRRPIDMGEPLPTVPKTTQFPDASQTSYVEAHDARAAGLPSAEDDVALDYGPGPNWRG